MDLDDDEERAVPEAWRPAISELVECLVLGDRSLLSSIPQVKAIPLSTWDACLSCLQEYGATLVSLPHVTWLTSVAMPYGGEWRCLIDLWTLEEGRSDLVLALEVVEVPTGPEIAVDMVYVP